MEDRREEPQTRAPHLTRRLLRTIGFSCVQNRRTRLVTITPAKLGDRCSGARNALNDADNNSKVRLLRARSIESIGGNPEFGR